MLSAPARARCTVVLVGARNPQNIGAAARAMQDFGFSDLRVVNAFAAPFHAAQLAADDDSAGPQPNGLAEEVSSAVAAGTVMRAARRFDTLADAIADCTLIVATTAIGDRTLTLPVRPLRDTAVEMVSAMSAADARVALLFGSEKTGLTSDQLSHAQKLTTIPMYQPVAADGLTARHLSMNLGQSVAVCLYELTREGLQDARELPVLHQSPATADDRERLTRLLLETMLATGYTRRFPANADEAVVRRLAQQLGNSHREAMTWMGVLKQVMWDKKAKTADNERATPKGSSA